MTTVLADKEVSKYDYVIIVWYVVLHAATLAGLWFIPLTTETALVFTASYCIRMFGLSAGYHRYFGHRSFKTTRTFQLLLAILAMSTAQRGVLWWASSRSGKNRVRVVAARLFEHCGCARIVFLLQESVGFVILLRVRIAHADPSQSHC